MRGPMRGRILFVLVVATIGWLALLGRGAYLTLVRHQHYEAKASQQQARVDTLPGVRGPIFDRHGRVLACTMENPSLAVRVRKDTDREELAELLIRAGACTPTQTEAITRAPKSRASFHWIQRRWISTPVVDALRGADRAIELYPEMKRFYPAGAIAPQLIGVTGVDGSGRSGLEWQFDAWLEGSPGLIMRFQTGGGLTQNAPPDRVLEDPDCGHGLVLTLDAQLQTIARHRLREGMLASNAICGSVIMLDPRSGEILALVEEPGLDPLAGQWDSNEQLKVHCVMDLYEPGSTFKIATYAAAFENGVIAPTDSVDCLHGVRVLKRGRIRDHRPFGVVTVAEAFSGSSNIGAGKIAEQTGWEALYQTAQNLGFGLTTGMGLSAEAAGSLPHPLDEYWSDRSLITMAYGQEVSCSALQMAMAMAAVANDGVLMKPLIVSAVVDGDGKLIDNFEPVRVRQAIGSETAHTMRELLRLAVTDGTGKAAELPWFPPAGKTGTAQIFDNELQEYLEDEHILTFCGFAPYDDPRILCQVIVRCPGDLHASDAAVPVFGAIMRDVAWMMEEHPWQMPAGPAPKLMRVTVPDVRGLTPLAARRALHRAGLVPVLDGLGERVEAMHPPALRAVSAGTIVELSLAGLAREETVVVPDVKGLSLRRAMAVLAEAGIVMGVQGSGWVIRQEPPSGREVAPGTRCMLWASAEASLARRDALQRGDVACETR